MLKRMLAVRLALIFLRFLSSVTGDEGFPGNSFPYDSLPYFLSTLKEMCLDRPDPLSCQYWEKITDYELPNVFRTKQHIENRTSGKEIQEGASQEDIPFDIPIVDADNNQQKRFSVFRRKNPTARGYKRGPGFRSWGGKRDLVADKRAKFASWGGKRDDEVFSEDLISESEDAAEKRQKFQSWGGKKSTNDFLGEEGRNEISSNQIEKREPIWKNRVFYLSEPFKKHVPKRPQFQSWGGKRGDNPWHDFLQFFHPQPRFLLNGGEKRKFSSWGGKRYDEMGGPFGNSHWEDKPVENKKRQGFQNWGGKRMDSENDSNAFTTKESGANENTKERSKREVKEVNEGSLLNYNFWGAQQGEIKNTR